jgi:hypothetical protein
MIYILQNLFPILAATSVGLAIGLIAVRLSSGLLPSPAALAIIVIAEFWMTCILAGALILAPAEAPRWIMAMATPFIIWIGFVAPAIAVLGAVEEVTFRSSTRTIFHWLIVMMANAATLEAIGLVAPPR